jgi:hypothetical protein
MATITYTAKRSVISGHTAGTVYDIEIDFAKFDPSKERHIETAVSLSGNTQTRLHRIDNLYDIETDSIPEALQPQVEEFFDSVAGGELFTIDLFGVTYIVRITDDPKFTRAATTRRFSYSFRVRKQS